METIEEFFKNRASFNRREINFSSLSSILNFTTKNIYNPEDYSLDFLKEKVKPLCYYLYSFLKEPRVILIRIWLDYLDDKGRHWYSDKTVMRVLFHSNNDSLRDIEEHFNDEKKYFCHKVPTKPFSITVEKLSSSTEEEDSEEEYSEEDSEEEEETINTEKTFKSDECAMSNQSTQCFVL